MIPTTGAFARQIQATATKLGVPLPDTFTAALATAQDLAEQAAQYDAVVAQLNARAVALLLADKDPTTDADINGSPSSACSPTPATAKPAQTGP